MIKKTDANINKMENLPPKAEEKVEELLGKDTTEVAASRFFGDMIVSDPYRLKRLKSKSFKILTESSVKKAKFMRNKTSEVNMPRHVKPMSQSSKAPRGKR